MTNTAYAPRTNVFARIGNRIMNALVMVAEANGRVKQIEHLQSMSDAELARRGIKRDEIVYHVFRDLSHV
ncbi:DUF1127 domain-containing protein [Ponticoccus litoralis]|uniref:DUF1127 domain-containing protein n=2 Tax=Ponticoccus TaxID=983507 RepID=A0AAW9SNJ9_9RHOB